MSGVPPAKQTVHRSCGTVVGRHGCGNWQCDWRRCDTCRIITDGQAEIRADPPPKTKGTGS